MSQRHYELTAFEWSIIEPLLFGHDPDQWRVPLGQPIIKEVSAAL